MLSHSSQDHLSRARTSLVGLAVGDGLGDRFFEYPFGDSGFTSAQSVEDAIAERYQPAGPWRFTDDTQMALSLYSILRQYERIDQTMLAFSFAARYDPSRGYGPAMHWLMRSLDGQSEAWPQLAGSLFHGQGSFGNGAAMRVAPLGAYFADDLDAVVEHAARSAEVTHTHPEAIAGAIATAVGAAIACRARGGPAPSRREFIDAVLPFIPDSVVREKCRHARNLAEGCSLTLAASVLGNGSEISAQDTVPFVLWCAGERMADYEEAFWLTVSALGDRDTTCAMVGGIIAGYVGEEGIPSDWRESVEPLPSWAFQETSE